MNLELDQDGHLVDYTIWNQEVPIASLCCITMVEIESALFETAALSPPDRCGVSIGTRQKWWSALGMDRVYQDHYARAQLDCEDTI